MALVLSLMEGQDFYADDARIVLTDVLGDEHFRVYVERTGKAYDVNAQQAKEILPDVMVSAGISRQASMARVVIDAPRKVLILRGDRYGGEAQVIAQKPAMLKRRW